MARADSESVAMAATLRTAKVAPAPSNDAMTMSLMVATNTGSEAAPQASGTVSLESDMIEDAPVDEAQAQAAMRLKVSAQEQVAAARAQFKESKSKLAGSSVTQVSGEFASIEQLMELGSTTLATKHYAEAQSDFTEALKRAIKLHVLLGAQANFSQNVITPILQKALETGTKGIEVPTFPAGI